MSVATPGPVKTVIECRVQPGREAEADAWIRDVVDAASRSPGLEGSSVLSGTTGDRFLLLRFANPDHLARWEGSPEYAELHDRGARLATLAPAQVRHGLTTWFTLPEHRTPADPVRWKMAVVTWCALFPQIVLLAWLFSPLGLSRTADQALSSVLCVASLNWVVMPFLTGRLHAWIVARPAGARP